MRIPVPHATSAENLESSDAQAVNQQKVRGAL